jgi:hypothetical protein
VDTRCYVHLAADGEAYYYDASPDRYVPIPAWRIFSAVFRELRGLGGVTEGQILDSRAAVDRLYEGKSQEAAEAPTPDDVYDEVYADQHRDR